MKPRPFSTRPTTRPRETYFRTPTGRKDLSWRAVRISGGGSQEGRHLAQKERRIAGTPRCFRRAGPRAWRRRRGRGTSRSARRASRTCCASWAASTWTSSCGPPPQQSAGKTVNSQTRLFTAEISVISVSANVSSTCKREVLDCEGCERLLDWDLVQSRVSAALVEVPPGPCCSSQGGARNVPSTTLGDCAFVEDLPDLLTYQGPSLLGPQS